MKIINSIATQAAATVDIRRDIHAHTELCFEERRTADIIANKLSDPLLKASMMPSTTPLPPTSSILTRDQNY